MSLDEMIDGVLIGSHEGVIIDANHIFCELSGRSRESLLGKHISDIKFTEESINRAPFRFDLLKNGEIVISEREMICENGTLISIEMRTKMLPNGTYISFYRDVSELKLNGIKLQDKIGELMNLNSDKNKFISVLAHDLTSPFNSILGFLSLLSGNFQKYDSDTVEKYITIIEKSVKNTLCLLQDTLSWAEVESKRFKFEPQHLKFSTICEEVIGNLKFIAFSKNISIENTIEKDLLVFADNKMLHIVLGNLISNAIKFTNKGGEIKVTANQINEDLVITVSDNGIGVDPEILNCLFNITEKMSTLGTEKEKGTGLGLILCKEFVEHHKGKIWVESEVGNGSDFKFSLPYEQSNFKSF